MSGLARGHPSSFQEGWGKLASKEGFCFLLPEALGVSSLACKERDTKNTAVSRMLDFFFFFLNSKNITYSSPCRPVWSLLSKFYSIILTLVFLFLNHFKQRLLFLGKKVSPIRANTVLSEQTKMHGLDQMYLHFTCA